LVTILITSPDAAMQAKRIDSFFGAVQAAWR
jgi:hypothetical protein